MMSALRIALESYLEFGFLTAEVVFPFPITKIIPDALRSVCSFLLLEMPLSVQPPAGVLAARAQGIGGKCTTTMSDELSDVYQEDDCVQLILTIDYSRAALIALLLVEECGVFEYKRVLHNTEIGTDKLQPNRDGLERALRIVTTLPLEDGNGAGIQRISKLVLMGEFADDSRLNDELKKVLLEQALRHIAMMGDGRARTINPVFAASRGVAQDCCDRMNFSVNGEYEKDL